MGTPLPHLMSHSSSAALHVANASQVRPPPRLVRRPPRGRRKSVLRRLTVRRSKSAVLRNLVLFASSAVLSKRSPQVRPPRLARLQPEPSHAGYRNTGYPARG